MNNSLVYFKEPLKTVENNPVACPYIKIKSKWNNTPIPHEQNMYGESLKEVCVPNVQSDMYVPGFGMNTCKQNTPVHLNFNVKSNCYWDNRCTQHMKTCYQPY